jgi:hypothetical protein
MSKKIMLLALAVASVAMFALPAAASAQELHLTGVTHFEGTGGAGTLTAEGEPTITCEQVHVTGVPSAGGTTGTLHLDFTGCHATVFGLTIKCHTSGSEKDNTITNVGTYHLITYKEQPAILVTPETAEIICAGISTTIVHGSVIGTIVSPGINCTTPSKEMTTKFTAIGNTQEHLEYTGVKYDLTATTGKEGAAKTAGLTSSATVKSGTLGTLDCT